MRVPLRRRPLDLLLVAFFLVNLLFVTYQVDLEQLVIADPNHFTYPLWPPGPSVDAVHWWGRSFDPLLMARPQWWKMTIWVDVLAYGPFYAIALYALWRDRPWIAIPLAVWAGAMLCDVTVIMGEEMFGAHATPAPLMVWAGNAGWFLFPLLAIYRAARTVRVSRSASPG